MSTYGQLTTRFIPTGAGTTLSCDFLYTPNGAIQAVLDGDQSAFSVTISGADVLSFNLLASVTIDGVAATSGVTVITEGYHTIMGDIDAAADIYTLAATTVLAAAAAAVSYRYFRVNITAGSGDVYLAMQDVELAAFTQGGDFTEPGMTATASNEFDANYTAGNAINGDLFGDPASWHTLDISPLPLTGWWKVDTGGSFPLAEVRIFPLYMAAGPGRAPRDFTIEGSNDDSNWDILHTATGIPWLQGQYYAELLAIEPIPAPAPVAYRYFRYYIKSMHLDNNRTSVQEIELATTLGGANITTPGMTCLALTSDPANPPESAINGEKLIVAAGDVWVTADGVANRQPTWWSIDTAGSFTLAEFRVWPQNDGNGPNRSAKDIDFAGSNDGVNWTIIKTFTGHDDWTAGQPTVFELAEFIDPNYFQTQLHSLILTDPLNGANSISIDASIEAETMPSDPDITNPSGLIKYGDWIDLHVTQPYVPLLKGGAEADRAYVAFKHEAYNGDFSA